MELNLYAQLSEEALIGSVFFSTETFLEISSELDINDFQSARCKTIFQAFHRLREEREPLEMPPLLNDLQKHSQLEAAGGEEFIAALAEKVSTVAGLGYHIKQVKEASATRRYVSLLEQGKADLEAGTPIGDVLRGAKEAILKLERYGFVGQDPFESLPKTLEDKFNRDMAQEPDKLLGYDLTIFARLAHDIKGIQPGFYIVAADTNIGKTSFLCSLTLDLLASNQDLTGIFFSLDDSKDVILNRLLAIAGGIPIDQVQCRPEGEYQTEMFGIAYKRLMDVAEDNRLFIRDMGEIPDIRAMEAEIKRRIGNKLFVVIDALYNLDVGGEWDQRMENIERANLLKWLSSSYKIPVICSGELVKSKDRIKYDQPPSIHDIVETGKFAYNANLVLMLYPEKWEDYDVQDEPKMFLKFEKNKLSHVRGRQEYTFERGTGRFMQYRPDSTGP